MFNKFTERSQRVLVLAQEEAIRLGHSNIGTEHLLLGLILEGEGIAAKALEMMEIDPDEVRQEVEKLIGSANVKPVKLSYTPRAKRVIELSYDEARRLGHSYIGTEHILLGLIREGEGVAAHVLNNLGVNLNNARQQVLMLLGSGDSSDSGTASTNHNTPTLDEMGRDLTKIAKEGGLDPVIGRDKEIERVIQVLSRRTKNNPVLIGEPGVGKTAIAEGLALKIESNEIPEILRGKRVVSLDMATVVAGTKYRGEFEERLKKVMDEVREDGNVIIFIDELHTLIGAGGAEGAIDASNIMKPALARGELQAIGATTIDEYRKYIEKDAALERRFQPIMVEEPTVEESIAILQGLRDRYEAHHRVLIPDNTIEQAVKLADRYISDRFLPDKAIDVIDEAASKVRLSTYNTPPNLKELEKNLEETRKEKESAVQGQEFEKAASLRDKEQKIRAELDETMAKWRESQGREDAEVTVEDVAQVIANWTGVPVKRLTEEEADRLIRMEEILHKRLIGQNEAVEAVARAIRRTHAGLKDPKRPIGSFIFLGPTGVGKTELARSLAEAMFEDENAIIRIDMSEYMEKHATSRLVGAPPGYVGYEEGGQLTEQIRRKPYSVVLLDEIEKAHPEVFNILLQVLEDGRLTDGKGRTVDFRNAIIIMTSNVGADLIKQDKTMGFATTEADAAGGYKDMKDKVLAELKKTFRPEFLNRVDEIIVFHSLREEELKQILDLMLEELQLRLSDREIVIELTDEAKDFLLKEGYDSNYGARPLRRMVQKHIEDVLSEELLKETVKSGDQVLLELDGDKLAIKKSEDVNKSFV